MTSPAATASADSETPQTAARRVAEKLTKYLAPEVLVFCLPLAVAAAHSAHLLQDLGWGLIISLTCSAIPMGIVQIGVRRGNITDRHARVREQRIIPLLFAVVSVIVGLALTNLGAPTRLRALTWAMLAGLVVTLVITLAWKISVHAAVAAGTVVILICVYGPILNLAWVLAAAVSWSRVRLGDHTLAQVLAGMAMGGVVAGAVYLALT